MAKPEPNHFHPELQRLLGCAWGTAVASNDDMNQCIRRATQRVMLHEGDTEIEVRLCDYHLAILTENTDPHTEETPT